MRVGLIGYGYWGTNLLRNFFAHEEIHVVMVADPRLERLALVKKTYPAVKTTTDTDELLKSPEIDAIIIATPVQTHYPLAKAALNHDKHVLVEKPLAGNLTEAEELVNLAAKKKLVLMVDHTFLYSGAVMTIKRLIDSGDIGNLQYFDSSRINLGLFQSDINVLWDLAPHDLSILLYITGKMPRFVNALGASHTKNGIENIAYLTLRYHDGFIAHLNASWVSPVKIRNILIGGTKKMLVYNDLELTEKVKVYESGFDLKTDEEKGRLYMDYRSGDIHIPKISTQEALSGVVDDFVQAVTKKKMPRSHGAFGRDVVRILQAAEESIKNGGKEIPL